VARTVTFIRHAETNSNRTRTWQGNLDSGLSDRGVAQLAMLGRRFRGREPSVVVASDLSRTMRTASAISDDVVPNAAWREFHVGSWEGHTSEEIMVEFPGQMEAFLAGEDIAPGGGELMSDFAARIIAAFDALVTSMGDDEEAVVVTHGGVIWALVSHILGISGRSVRIMPPFNTSATIVTVPDDGVPQLTVFNDAGHLDHTTTHFGPAGPRVTLLRHGQTEGNVLRRWQGRSDSPLTDLGLRQTKAATSYVPDVRALFTSPLGRTVQTAKILGDALGVEPREHEGFAEMGFGAWENLTTAEAAQRDPELFAQIYEHGIDLPRGGDGETFGSTGTRFAEALDGIVTEEGDDLAVVSHGAAIRAFTVNVMGLEFADRERLPVPRNTSMSSVIYAEGGTVLGAYNVAPHLEDVP
jgi:probable phosphoglycerate mutase